MKTPRPKKRGLESGKQAIMRARCAQCGSFHCSQERPSEGGNLPKFCPMREQKEVLQEARAAYGRPVLREIFLESSRLEGQYRKIPRTRLEETMVFAEQMGYRKLGLAFCLGLQREASTIARVLEARGFQVIGACCKMGRMPKEEMGLAEEEKIRPFHFEACCNPIGQAEILRKEGTEFNVMVGLCVGHDSLFIGHSAAPVTCLIAKDRVLGHNPAAAVYTCESYYREKLLGEEP